MEIGEKIRFLRESEGLTRDEFADKTELSARTLEGWETLKRKISVVDIQKITQHEQFSKYTLWLLNDIVMPEAGQISPEMEEKRGLRA